MRIKKKLNTKAISQMRRKKFGFGMGTLTTCILSLVIFALINFVGMKIYYRGSINHVGTFDLSPKTLRLLDNINGDLNIYVLVQNSNRFYSEVKNLLGEYSFYLRKNRDLNFDIHYIDPERDVSRVEMAANKFGLDVPNVVVFELDNRYKVVSVDDIAGFTKELTAKGIKEKLATFNGELMFSSAILDVSKDETPVVYYLTGHSEADFSDFHKTRGYSKIASLIEQDNIEIRPLLLASAKVVPEDASCIIVAGPVQGFANFELKSLKAYLKNGGRIMFLLDF